MSEFRSADSYWHFAQAVRRESRHVHTTDVQAFLEAVRATSIKRETTIPAGSTLWRSQLGSEWRTQYDGHGNAIGEEEMPLPPARMKPIPGEAREGRLNPRGIACLYLSTDMETAMAESRPWIHSPISVGEFLVVRDLRLVDCRPNGRIYYFGGEPSPEERERAVWADIDAAFARPLARSDDDFAYLPTQILAELFRRIGFEGVVYRSSCGPGFNVACFDLAAAELRDCALYEVRALKYDFRPSGTPYAVAGTGGERSISPARRAERRFRSRRG
jgi:hypothetical protein